jgi:nucleotide-binding universal stress UspA family protein
LYKRLLVPLDGSTVAESILPFVEQVAGPLDAEVVLLNVIEPPSPGEIVASVGVVSPDVWRARELEVKQYLAGLERRLAAKGLRVERRLQMGRAADEILAAATALGADLIAMTTHGRSGIARLLFGSVAEAVLRGSTVPLLMFRVTPARREREATTP